jgi:2,3-dihydroxyethylbenzene 1,2-dioxygenase
MMGNVNLASVTELGYVRLGVSNLEEWRSYVTKILGLEVRDDMPGDKLWVRNDLWHHRICIEQNQADDLIGMGLRVAGREEFRAMKKRLADAGIPFEVGSEAVAIERHVIEIMMLRDPGGNPVEIFHGPFITPSMPFHPARRRYGKFVTGEAGLGHMIIRHGGIEETYDFYALLGMRSASEFRVPIPGLQEPVNGRFMHCNRPGAREHTLAFGLPSEKHCNHLMMEVDNIEDLMVTYRLAKDSSYPIMIDIGRHYNDNAFSFYFKSPSGFLIEVSYGCRPISDQSYLANEDYFGHEPNPEFPAHMGAADEVRKK